MTQRHREAFTAGCARFGLHCLPRAMYASSHHDDLICTNTRNLRRLTGGAEALPSAQQGWRRPRQESCEQTEKAPRFFLQAQLAGSNLGTPRATNAFRDIGALDAPTDRSRVAPKQHARRSTHKPQRPAVVRPAGSCRRQRRRWRASSSACSGCSTCNSP